MRLRICCLLLGVNRMRTQHGWKWILVLAAVAVVGYANTVRTADSLVAEAARAGDVVAVRSLISNGEDVNEPQVDGSTAPGKR